MNKITLTLLSFLLVFTYDQVARAAGSNAQSEIGKFIIVPAGHTGLDAKNLRGNTSTLFAAWRLNTETGALEFCTYDAGGVVVGKSVTPESLKCTPENRNAAAAR